MTPWEQRANQPIEHLSNFIRKTSFPEQTIPENKIYNEPPKLKVDESFPRIQPYGGHAITQEHHQYVAQQKMNEQKINEQETEHPIGGTVALMWKEANVDSTKIPKEDGFPTYSDVYLCEYTDYTNEEEKINAVKKYQDLINQYNAKPNPKGSYVIFTGFVVSRLATKTIILY